MNRQDFFDRIDREHIELGVEFGLLDAEFCPDLLRLANGQLDEVTDDASYATIDDRRDRAQALARSWDASFDELSGFDRDWVVDAIVAADRTDVMGQALDDAGSVYVVVSIDACLGDARAETVRDALTKIGVAKADLEELTENLMDGSSAEWPRDGLYVGFVAQARDIARRHDQQIVLTVSNPMVQIGLQGQDYPTEIDRVDILLDRRHEAESVEFGSGDPQVLSRRIRTIEHHIIPSPSRLSHAQRVKVACELVTLGRHGDLVRGNLVELNRGWYSTEIERAVFESNRLAYKNRMGRRCPGSKAAFVKAAKAAATAAVVDA